MILNHVNGYNAYNGRPEKDYTRRNYDNNIEQVVEPESSPQSGVRMLNNIVDNIVFNNLLQLIIFGLVVSVHCSQLYMHTVKCIEVSSVANGCNFPNRLTIGSPLKVVNLHWSCSGGCQRNGICITGGRVVAY